MYTLPHTIENTHGEKLIFQRIVGDRLEVEGFVQPGAGPTMHVHWKQDESLTVVSGKMAIEILGESPKYYGPGETATFMRGTWHRFWNCGEEQLHIKGWINPPNNIVFFLSELYKALDKGQNGRPELMTTAFLATRYRSEFGVHGIPVFVEKVIIPIQYVIGTITGAYKKYKDAPAPI